MQMIFHLNQLYFVAQKIQNTRINLIESQPIKVVVVIVVVYGCCSVVLTS